nr:DUF2235 domain-containing protein [Vibrio brasiliensis]
MFFDGTANNTYSAKWGKSQLEARYHKWKAAYEVSKKIAKTQDIHPTQFIEQCFDLGDINDSASNELTNVQKLFDLYQSNSFNDSQTVFRYARYITGIGTGNSTDIAQAKEYFDGKGLGMGKYGIIDKVKTGVEDICSQLESIIIAIKDESSKVDGFNKIEFDVFGFSRGAAAARHCINTVLEGQQSLFAQAFINTLQQLKGGYTLTADFDWDKNDHCEVMFAGLFDTVTAYGVAHDDDNEPVRLWLDPDRVRKAVHLVANKHTEYRYNFSLNKLNPAPHFDELVLPGAHSDIGGGYHSRIAFSQAEFLLPMLENKRIKTAENTGLSFFGRSKQLAALTTELNQVLDVEVQHGWHHKDYLLTDPEITYEGKNTSGAQAHLLYRKCTEGDLSRLYLRVMYGLAEFAGVPVNEEQYSQLVWEHQDQQREYRLYYPVQSELRFPHRPRSFDFGLLCQRMLDTAKGGDVNKLQQLLGSNEMRNLFMELGLIHHSSDIDDMLGLDLITPNEPHIINGRYQREEYEGE